TLHALRVCRKQGAGTLSQLLQGAVDGAEPRMRAVVLLAFSAVALSAATVPTPETHFGHRMGADGKLLDWDKVVSYFYTLQQASNKIRVDALGKTTDGRPYIAAIIAAPD